MTAYVPGVPYIPGVTGGITGASDDSRRVAAEAARLAGRGASEVRQRASTAVSDAVSSATGDRFSQWGAFLFDRAKSGLVNWYSIQIGIVLIILGLLVVLREPIASAVGTKTTVGKVVKAVA